MPKIFNWFASEVLHVFFRKEREVLIEVRVLFESETLFFVSETAEIPKNFCQIRIFAEHLWHRIRYGVALASWCSRFTMVGFLSGRDFNIRNSTVILRS